MRFDEIKSAGTLDAVLNTALDAVVVMDADGIVTGWNKVAEGLFGWSGEEAIGRRLSNMIIPPEARARHEQGMERFLSTGKTNILGKRVEVTGLARTGQALPLELSVIVLVDQGRPTFVAFIRDLTERRQAEQKVAQLQAEVIHLSRLGAMGSMASMLAHEINQPLAAAANYLAATQRIMAPLEEASGADAMFPLQQALKAVLRAGETIRMVRDMTSQKQSPHEDHDLYAMVQETVRLLGSNIAPKPTVLVSPEAAKVRVNRVQIEHVLLNLIKNASEVLAGEERPVMRVLARGRDDGRVEVRVEDNGRGICSQVRERLFSPFNTSKSEGSGLGLSICRAIVEQHDGKIWAEELEQGTAFCFTVPKADGNGAKAAA
ncbi:MAG TPA: ATP-binding protein [Allosphingosinicella sp.]|nr:ATP-binding protein [Allosphingosinicella sp.]